MNISCIIIDDEPLAGNLLEDYISKVPYLRLHKKCLTALEGLTFLQTNSVDLIFLDINLPHLSGMDFAKIIPRDQKVIFTTAYTSYAVESYTVNAVDYLLKPITFERFMLAVDKVACLQKQHSENATTRLTDDKKNIFIKSGKAMIKIQIDEICLIEGLRDYVVFWLAKEKHIVYKKMKELEEILAPDFMRVHHSFIVNVNHIKKIEDNHIYILDRQISITEKYREAFLSFVKNRLV
jgi:two-component system, LytTR family, response regulator